MEILIFALIASYNAHQRQGFLVAEPEEFRPFDLKALRHFAGNKAIGRSSRRKGICATNRLITSTTDSKVNLDSPPDSVLKG